MEKSKVFVLVLLVAVGVMQWVNVYRLLELRATLTQIDKHSVQLAIDRDNSLKEAAHWKNQVRQFERYTRELQNDNAELRQKLWDKPKTK